MSQPRGPDLSDEDATWRARWVQSSLRERLDEPLERASELTRKTLAWFPIRVWRHFLQHNGFLLAAGVSYQSLFAIFAAVYVAFAIVGVWLGGSPDAVDGMIDLINGYIPGLISENGLVKPEQVAAITAASAGTLTVTGLIALGVVIWTAIGFITFTRRAVRDIFLLPFDRRSYFLLKARDLLAAAIFGAALIAGWALGQAATWALDLLLSLLGYDGDGFWAYLAFRALSILVAVVINALALASLFRFLAGASLHWRQILPGATLGGAAIAVLQTAAGLLVLYSPSNPLLATFAIFVGFLLWFRINGVIILVAAAWIAIAAKDRNVPLAPVSEYERRVAEHQALLLAAQVRLRDARAARQRAPWYRAWAADRAVRQAADELAEVEAAAPAPESPRGLLVD